MRCCGSPTTSSAAEPPRAVALRRVIDAVLFREILKPVCAGLGPVAETAVDAVADRIAGARARMAR